MKLSIIIPVYNHEKYIEETINGILKQKIDFEYEVFIGEDCSTDCTRDILRRMEPTLPSCFHVFYREQNMGALENYNDMLEHASGEYLTSIEGDDFWIYDEKIKKQIDFLDNNKEYIACAHNVVVVDQNSNPNGEEYPECKDDVYTMKHFGYGILPGQIASIVYRNIFLKDSIYDTSLYACRSVVGDRKVILMLALQGKIRCFQECWSAYRHVTVGGSSYSATFKYDKAAEQLDRDFGLNMISFAEKMNDTETATILKASYYKHQFEQGYHFESTVAVFKDKYRFQIIHRMLMLVKFNHVRRKRKKISKRFFECQKV